MADKFNDIKEATYESKKKEPLGHSFSRKYDWPSRILPKHVFGLGSKGLESAKEMISPRRHMTIETETMAADLYKKSHNAYEPGEQRKRDYVWPVKPENFVFGFSEGKVKNGARDAIHHERADEQFPRSIVIRKDAEDYTGITNDTLGRSKNLGQGQLSRSPSPTYGQATLPKGEVWNAAHCLQGEP